MFSASLYSLVTIFGTLSVSAAPSTVKRDSLPDYVITYAPYSYLYSGEGYWPSDVAVHLQHVVPEINNTEVASSVSMANVATYGSDVYLTSLDDQSNSGSIDWLQSVYGKPDSTGLSASAPATIIAVEKDGGVVDAFYMYFYSYNFGPEVVGLHWGNHVGDWEYNMVRFINGVPTYFYYSEHSGGAAFDWSAIPTNSGRPINYIATGSHANYPTAGEQDYEPEVPFGILHDTTDAGVFWDVTKNYRGFLYDVSSQVFTSSGGAGQGAQLQASEGVDWLKFTGLWGDQQWATNRDGQYCISSECHISGGPTGPWMKNLGRTAVCENESSCTIQSSI